MVTKETTPALAVRTNRELQSFRKDWDFRIQTTHLSQTDLVNQLDRERDQLYENYLREPKKMTARQIIHLHRVERELVAL